MEAIGYLALCPSALPSYSCVIQTFPTVPTMLCVTCRPDDAHAAPPMTPNQMNKISHQMDFPGHPAAYISDSTDCSTQQTRKDPREMASPSEASTDSVNTEFKALPKLTSASVAPLSACRVRSCPRVLFVCPLSQRGNLQFSCGLLCHQGGQKGIVVGPHIGCTYHPDSWHVGQTPTKPWATVARSCMNRAR